MNKKKFKNNFLKSLVKIKRYIKNTVVIDESLAMAELYGNILWKNHCGIYYDEDIEIFLYIKIYAILRGENCIKNFTKGDGVVVIASELYNSGGHSNIVETWLRLGNSNFCPHKLIGTRAIAKEVLARLSTDGISCNLCSSGGLKGIEDILAVSSGCSTAVFHIHPDDIIAAIAMRLLRSLGVECIFYNHADHVFSWGIGGADIVCEVSRYGYELNNKAGRVKGKTFFLGIPIKPLEIKKKDSIKPAIKNNKKMVLSCGSSYKFKPEDQFSFPYFIKTLLSLRGDFFIVLVGPTGEEDWWAELRKIHSERVVFLGQIESSRYVELLPLADIYIDSFPIIGGTAFPQAIIAGVPSTGLNGFIQGYSVADCLRVDFYRDLEKRVNKLFEGDKSELARFNIVRRKIKKNHSIENFKNKILKLYKNGYLECADDEIPLESNSIDISRLEIFWCEARTVNIIKGKILQISNRIGLQGHFLMLLAGASWGLKSFLKVVLAFLVKLGLSVGKVKYPKTRNIF